MSGSAAEKSAWVKATFGIDVDAPQRQPRPAARLQTGMHRQSPPAATPSANPANDVSGYAADHGGTPRPPAQPAPAQPAPAQPDPISAYSENPEFVLRAGGNPVAGGSAPPAATNAGGEAEATYADQSQVTLPPQAQPAQQDSPSGDDDNVMDEDFDSHLQELIAKKGDEKLPIDGPVPMPGSSPVPAGDIPLPLLQPERRPNPGEDAHNEVVDDATKLADYAARQAAALAQWAKAELPKEHIRRVTAGREGWLQARKSFRDWAKDPYGGLEVPDLSSLYVTPPSLAELKAIRMVPVTLDSAMSQLALSLPGKLVKAGEIADKQSKEIFDAHDALCRTAGTLLKYVTDQIDAIAALQKEAEAAVGSGKIRPTLLDGIKTGKSGWENVRGSFTDLEAGAFHTPVPDLTKLYVTPARNQRFNDAGLPQITLDPNMLKAATSLERGIADMQK